MSLGALAWGFVVLAILGSLAGLYGTIHHSGVNEGRAEVQKDWDAQSAKSLQRIAANKARQEALRQAQDKEATRRLADGRRNAAALMASLEAHIKAAGSSAQCPMSPSLRDDWNRANGGPEGVGPGAVPSPSRTATPAR